MNKRLLPFYLALLSLLIVAEGRTQSTDNALTVRLQGTTLDAVLDELNTATQLTLYQNVKSDLNYSGQRDFQQMPISDILDQVLENTFYSHISYRDYGIVIVDRTVIDQEFSAAYYEALGEQVDNGEAAQVIGDISRLSPSGSAIISGIITDVQTGEPVIGATISVEGMDLGAVSEVDGSYELSVTAGTHEIQVDFIGYADYRALIDVKSDGQYNIALDKGALELDEVTIRARAADQSVESAQIGVQTISMNTIKKLPTFMGEVDVVKSFLLQPGVTTIGEGASGFNVRGGNVDQNLIMQDETFIFNSSHSLGFFSTFNSDLIDKVDLYKANIPAQYGGRLVSVMDVEMKDGNFEAFKIKGGIGPISSKLSLEGPIIKDKVSFIGGFRSSYTDWLLNSLSEPELQKSSSFFYDGNFRMTIKPSPNHSIALSAYKSQDDFEYNEEFGFDYSTQFGELSYGWIISDNLFSKFSAVKSQYDSRQSDLDGIDASTVDTQIDYVKLKENIKYIPSEELELNVGVSTIQYDVNPGERNPLDDESVITTKLLENEKGRETAAYVNAQLGLSEAIEIDGGIRATYYQYLGPKTEYQYSDESRPTTAGIIGTELKDGTIQSYSVIEPRVSARLKVTDEASIKAGYSRTSQFISQIFNADSPTPTSQWQLSNRYIKPLRSHNVSIGYFKNFKDNEWETSFELYGRQIDQLFDYQDFADLIVNEHIETELLDGEGRAYGAELSIRKKAGKVNGWLSYTYAKSERQIVGINDGEWYPSNFDKTHDVSLIFNYNPNQRNTLTANINYSTGRPTTPPVGNYRTSGGLIVPIFSDRNALRIPDYFRVDLSYTLGKGYKVDQKFQTSWVISLYNVLGRKNPYSVFFTQAPFNLVQANKFSVLGSVFPSITLNFELL